MSLRKPFCSFVAVAVVVGATSAQALGCPSDVSYPMIFHTPSTEVVDITESSATVRMTNVGGDLTRQSSRIYLEYGTTPSYGQQTASVPFIYNAGASFATGDATFSLTGLKTDTTYHLRYQATLDSAVYVDEFSSDGTCKEVDTGTISTRTETGNNETFKTSDTVAPNVSLSLAPVKLRKVKRIKRFLVGQISANETATSEATAVVTVKGKNGKIIKRFKLANRTRNIDGNSASLIKFPITLSQRNKLSRYILNGKTAKATVTATVTDTAGNKKDISKTVRITR